MRGADLDALESSVDVFIALNNMRDAVRHGFGLLECAARRKRDVYARIIAVLWREEGRRKGPEQGDADKQRSGTGDHHCEAMILHARIPSRDQDRVPVGKFRAPNDLDEIGDQFGGAVGREDRERARDGKRDRTWHTNLRHAHR